MKRIIACLLLVGCGQNGINDRLNLLPYFPTSPANLKLFITDKPLDNVSEVNVNIDHLELLLERGGKQARVHIAPNLGTINLLNFRNGVLLGVSDINIPEDVTVKQIRMILKEDGHELVRNDHTICQLKTPSAQKAGIKILLSRPITLRYNTAYAMVIDFDAEKSVVQMGNDDCLLKPVLKLATATSVPADSVDDDGNSSESPDDLADGTDQGDEFDTTDPDNIPVIDPDYDPIVSYFF
jgi:hypothetical protein